MPPLEVALSLIGIIIIIAGAYYATYYIGLKASGQNRSKNRGRSRNINLLERFAISKDKSFCIVEVAGKIYIVGVANQSMTLFDVLEAAEFEKFAPESGAAARDIMPGGPFGGKLVNKLASIMAQRMGRTYGTAENKNIKGETFADSLKSASDKNSSGQPDGSEEEE